MFPSTISPLEIVWTLPAVFGFLRYGQRWRMYWSERQYQDMRSKIGESRAVRMRAHTDCEVANIRCVRFAFLTFGFWIFMMIGLMAMMTPQTEVTVDSLIISGLLIAVEVSLIVKGEVLDSMEDVLYAKVSKLIETLESQ